MIYASGHTTYSSVYRCWKCEHSESLKVNSHGYSCPKCSNEGMIRVSYRELYFNAVKKNKKISEDRKNSQYLLSFISDIRIVPMETQQ